MRGIGSPRAQMIVAAALPVAYLAPLLTKAVHIDDPLYLWVARQIQADTLHPYAFDVRVWESCSRHSSTRSSPARAARGVRCWDER